tara:strand:+ start:920 stop:1924 length:1005 start_codon:yes stop_codon:yes gene_type:complete
MLTLLLIIIVLLLLLLIVFNPKYSHFTPSNNGKPCLWVYLENGYNTRKWESFYSQSNTDHVPDYLKLCLDTIKLNCEDSFDIKLITPDNVTDYLPGFKKSENLKYMKDKMMASVLTKYGGLWMPISTLVFKDLIGLHDEVVNTSFFGGFHCDYDEYRCNLGSNKLLNESVFIAPKNSKVTRELLEKLNNLENKHISDYEFLKSGQQLMAEVLNKYADSVKLYPASVSGTRDCVMKSISADNLLSNNNTSLLDVKTTQMVTFDRKLIDENTRFNWFSRASKKQILLADIWFSKLAQVGLNKTEITTFTTKQDSKDNYIWKKIKNYFIGKSPTRNS